MKFCLIFLLIISTFSCKKTTEELLIGTWKPNGNVIISQNDTLKYAASELSFVTYEYFANKTFKTSHDSKGKWKVEKDSLLFIDMDSVQENYVIHKKSKNEITLTTMINDIEYNYDLIKIDN